ncbi:MAG TPA: alpha/beta hydrolase [Friedmanniella sp.]
MSATSSTTGTAATSTGRVAISFTSGGVECAAWHYPGTNGACVVMAGGFAVTKEPGTDLFARAFADAGFTVLAFDHRHLGGSGGTPRQVAPVREQLEDWYAALGCATTLPGVDPARLAAWGFSVSGGHVVRVAARWPGLGAAIAQTPNVDGPAAARNAARWTTRAALVRLLCRGLLDTFRGFVGAEPLLVPLVGPPGTVALLSSPDAQADGDRALDPDGRHPGWVRAVAARSALAVTAYRPGRDASRVACPLLVVVAEQDRSAPAGPAARAAGAAPRGELVRLAGGHYTAFLDAHARAVDAELSFLRRHLLPPVPA